MAGIWRTKVEKSQWRISIKPFITARKWAFHYLNTLYPYVCVCVSYRLSNTSREHVQPIFLISGICGIFSHTTPLASYIYFYSLGSVEVVKTLNWVEPRTHTHTLRAHELDCIDLAKSLQAKTTECSTAIYTSFPKPYKSYFQFSLFSHFLPLPSPFSFSVFFSAPDASFAGAYKLTCCFKRQLRKRKKPPIDVESIFSPSVRFLVCVCVCFFFPWCCFALYIAGLIAVSFIVVVANSKSLRWNSNFLTWQRPNGSQLRPLVKMTEWGRATQKTM